MTDSARRSFIITGAAGFIGSHICRRLLSLPETRTVIGIDSISSYYPATLKQRRVRTLLKDRRFRFRSVSITDLEGLGRAVRGVSSAVLIHAAAEVGVRNGELHPERYFYTNVYGAAVCIETVKTAIERAIVLSSSSVYAKDGKVPYKEDFPVLHAPASVYGISKAVMEHAVKLISEKYSLPLTIIRPFSVYGPDGRPDMLPMKLLIAALTGRVVPVYGVNVNSRDWTFIDDFLDGLMRVLETPKPFDIVNIATGKTVTLNETMRLAKQIVGEYGYHIRSRIRPANDFELPTNRADVTKLKTVYGISLPSDFETGFRKTAAYFFHNQSVYRRIYTRQ